MLSSGGAGLTPIPAPATPYLQLLPTGVWSFPGGSLSCLARSQHISVRNWSRAFLWVYLSLLSTHVSHRGCSRYHYLLPKVLEANISLPRLHIPYSLTPLSLMIPGFKICLDCIIYWHPSVLWLTWFDCFPPPSNSVLVGLHLTTEPPTTIILPLLAEKRNLPIMFIFTETKMTYQ